MRFKSFTKRLLCRSSQIAPSFTIGCYETAESLRRILLKSNDDPWKRIHPYDCAYGVNTSGMVPGYMLRADKPHVATTFYCAIQPSILRKVLATIPRPETCEFLDIGCGKGRAMLIAWEFGFHSITGI